MDQDHKTERAANQEFIKSSYLLLANELQCIRET